MLTPDFQHLSKYTKDGYYDAPTMCAEGGRFGAKSHGVASGTRGVYEDAFFKGGTFSYEYGKQAAIESHEQANPDSKCKRSCIGAQLDSFYGKGDDRQLQASAQNQSLKPEQREAAQQRTGLASM